MEKRLLGKTGMQVSVLGFGGAEIGFENQTEEAVGRLLNSALDAGLNVIDTAECYVESEELIGRTVSQRRSEYFLFTKCGHGDTYDEDRWTPEGITASIDRSLRRLRSDYVDLVQFHSCRWEALADGRLIAALEKARKEGKTRYIGYSGDGENAVYAIKTGAFDTLQTSVSIADQEAIDLLLPLTRERNMGVIAKRPIANAAWRWKSLPDYEYARPYWERLKKLDYDFLNGDAGRAASMALRFTLSVPGVHTAIVGTSKPGRWSENARMLDEQGLLSEEEFQSIRRRWRETARPDWVGQV